MARASAIRHSTALKFAGIALAAVAVLRLLPATDSRLRLTTKRHEIVLPAAAHAGPDVGHRFIAGALALLVTSLAVITLGVLWAFPLPTLDRTLNLPLPLYPAPRLQPSPRQEMQRFLAEEMQQLGNYGWIDKAHGIVRIPIDAAMAEIAQRGIPDWPANQAAAGAATAQAEKSATTTAMEGAWNR